MVVGDSDDWRFRLNMMIVGVDWMWWLAWRGR